MRVTNINLYSPSSKRAISLSYRDPGNQSPYQVKNISGLDVDEIVPQYYGSAWGSGDKYFTLSQQKREVVVRVGLNPGFGEYETYSTLRDDLYRLISSSRTGEIRLDFNDGLTTSAILTGFISKFEASHFTATPEIQFTVKCDNPMLRAPNPVLVDVGGLDPLDTVITDDISTAPHGLRFEAHFTAPVPTFYIVDNTLEWLFGVTPSTPFLAGDVLTFSSEFNAKALYFTRGSVKTYLADVVMPGSIWPLIFPGDNQLVCPEATVWDSISYYPTFWGI